MMSRNIKILGKGNAVCVEESLPATPLSETEALVQNEASFISTGTELSRVYAIKKGVEYPVYPGYSAIGHVLQAGPRAGVKPGDRVMYSGAHKEFQVCEMGANSLKILYPIPDEPDSISASLMHIGLIALNAPIAADIKLGDTVCVYGMGLIGVVVALLCQIAGAEVLGIDTVENRTLHAKTAGVHHVVCADGPAQVQAVKDFFGTANGADICIDASGVSPAIENAILSTGTGGQVVLLGSPRSDYTCNITPMLNHIHMKMLTVTGAFNGRFPFYPRENSRQSIEKNIRTMARLMASGQIDAGKLISHVIKPEEIMTAYDGLYHHQDEYFAVAIDWTR